MNTLTKEFNVKAGETFTIELESNITTGYGWYLQVKEGKASCESAKYVPDAPMSMGSGGKDVFVFKAKETGLVKIEAQYKRNYSGPM